MSPLARHDPFAVHIPDLAGRPICGAATGQTSVLAFPTCADCHARTRLSGMRAQDAFNPAHPVGRIVIGSGVGVPGFPQIPGIWKPFRGG